MKAYYARCMAIYGTARERKDEDLIRKLGYEPIDFKTDDIEAAAKLHGMQPFKPLVKSADILFFRGLPDGRISAGVMQEIRWAQESGIPVLELPHTQGRGMTLEDTREYLRAKRSPRKAG
jgi:hypothetical protein